jgi:hypothetical protein
MRKIFLALMVVHGVAAAEPKKIVPGTYPEKVSAWKKFAIQGIAIGTPLSKLTGFTCSDQPAVPGGIVCVKFIDPRCAQRPTKIKNAAYLKDVPAGSSCFMDGNTNSTYLDRKAMAPPLFSVAVQGTETTNPIVYRVSFTFAKDVVDNQSKLGQALVAKYGKPTSTNEPMSWSWTDGDVTLGVMCGAIEGPTGEFCTLYSEDLPMHFAERSIQEAADDAAKHTSAPPPPKL